MSFDSGKVSITEVDQITVSICRKFVCRMVVHDMFIHKFNNGTFFYKILINGSFVFPILFLGLRVGFIEMSKT